MKEPEKIVIQLVTTEAQLANFIGELIDRKLGHLAEARQIPLPEPQEELLSVKQVARFFQVTETTIHSWKRQGLLPYVKVKSRVRFRKTEILKLNDKQRKYRGK